MLRLNASESLPYLLAVVDTQDDGEADKTLEDVARDEREYVRGRLRQELSRDPTDEEIDTWLREQTEGY